MEGGGLGMVGGLANAAARLLPTRLLVRGRKRR
jgi:hypothetical protein